MENFDYCKINFCFELIKPVHILLGTNVVTADIMIKSSSCRIKKSILIMTDHSVKEKKVMLQGKTFILFKLPKIKTKIKNGS